jgi:hypothetical protein
MEKKKIDKIIEAFRNYRILKEDAPTMSVGNGEKSLGYNIQSETPPVDLRKGKRRYWNPFFKDLVKMQRRKNLR